MSALAGLGPLLRLAWRRDRVLVPISVLAITGSAVSGAQATLALYPTSASMGEAVRAVVTNPAALALYGPVADPTSPDAFAVYKMGTLGGVFLVLLGYALVRRHTRSEEDLGRLELLGAGVVGRRAPLAAAVILATAAVLVTCLLTLAGYVSIGMGVAGSAASVAGWAAAALAFVGVTAVTAQVSSTARGCAGLTLGVLGASYLLRAVVDGNPSSPQWLIWLSPLGWAEQAQAFAVNRTWVALLGVAALAAGLLSAGLVLERRDLGAGLIATRTGAANASPRLSTALGLAWRQGRAGLAGWAAGFAVMGVVVGGLLQSATEMLSDPGIADMLAKMGGGTGSLIGVYLSTEFGFAAVVAAAFGVTVTLRLRSQEAEGYAEQLLATRTTRLRYLASHTLVALLGVPILLAVMALGIRLADSSGLTDGVGALLGAALARVPAAWVCVGIAATAFAVAKHAAAAIAWGALSVFLLLGEFGALLGLPDSVITLSPFAHSPRLPLESFRVLPVVLLVAVTAALVGLAATVWRRRDIG